MSEPVSARSERSRRFLLLRHPIAVGGGVLGLVVLLIALWIIRDVLLLGFFALLIAVVFSFPVAWLSKVMPRGAAVVVVLVAVLGGFGALGALAVPPLAEQGKELAGHAPEALENAKAWLERTARQAKLPAKPQELSQKVQEHATSAVTEAAKNVLPAVFSVAELATTCILILVMAAFLVHAPEEYRDAIRTMVPREWEPHFDETCRRLAVGLRHWVGGIMVSMLLMGAFTAIALWLAGIHGWYLLAILTFLGTFVPYLGAISSAIPGLVVGLSQSPAKFVAAGAVYLGVHIVEGYFVQPLVMKRAVTIRPATLLFGQAVAGALFGVLGLVVAAPMIVCLKAAVGYLYVERRVGKPGPQP
jgi:predicted PurR-regulated permease PerM